MPSAWLAGSPISHYITCERATADGPREHARQIEHADAFEGVSDVPGIAEHPLGRVADLGYE